MPMFRRVMERFQGPYIGGWWSDSRARVLGVGGRDPVAHL